MSKTTAIIVAGGQGTRLNRQVPKQYLPLGARNIISMTLEKFLNHPQVNHIICVISPEHEDLFLASIKDDQSRISWTYGGDTRQESVLNGLLKAKEEDPSYVLIHDAARPFVSAQTISDIIEKLHTDPACLPVTPISDSLKQLSNEKLENIDRTNLFSAQTPQGFDFKKILTAHQKAAAQEKSIFTDDIALAEWAHLQTTHIPGTKKNFKITTSEDYEMARQLTSQQTQTRIGHGYDVHAFEKGSEVILCGVKIPFSKKLKGHSDADVGLHALTDAIYGAISDGDIGHHFPPSDEKWKGASSHVFLEHAVERVKLKGGIISNLDVTLVCEAPKIGPHRNDMCQAIATITGLQPEQISVKATTSEGLGFTGRSEGISAFATACIILEI